MWLFSHQILTLCQLGGMHLRVLGGQCWRLDQPWLPALWTQDKFRGLHLCPCAAPGKSWEPTSCFIGFLKRKESGCLCLPGRCLRSFLVKRNLPTEVSSFPCDTWAMAFPQSKCIPCGQGLSVYWFTVISLIPTQSLQHSGFSAYSC